jgi:hypothetical protein
MQPVPKSLDCRSLPVRNDLDGAVRQIAGDTADGEKLGLGSRTVPEIHALNLPGDDEAAAYWVHARPVTPMRLGAVLMRLTRGWRVGMLWRLGVRRIAMLCARERGTGMVLGFHCGQTGARILLRLDVLFSAVNRSLRGIQVR